MARGRSVYRRKPRAPWRVRAVALGSWAALTLVAGAVAGLVLLVVVYPSGSAGAPERRLEVTIAPNEPLDAVVQRLAAAGIVARPFVFSAYARLLGADERLRPGTTIVTGAMTPRQIVQRIAVGFGEAPVDVLVPEGVHRFDIAARLERWGVCERNAFLAATRDRTLLEQLAIPGPSAEGYLFPDTYRFRSGMDPREVVRRMVANHRRRTGPVLREHASGLERLRRDLGWGAHEALILASVVEREAAVRDELPIIAGVFLNRLRDPSFVPHRLDADPTVAYGCLERPEAAPSCAGFRGQVDRTMTHDPANPYNTYRIEGLPPGPIGNPGLGALRAVLAPAEHDFYYFVAVGAGRHAFSRTHDEHLRRVAAARTTGPQASAAHGTQP